MQTKQMADHLEQSTKEEIIAGKQAKAQQAIEKLSKRQAKEKEDLVARHEAAMDVTKAQHIKEKEQMVKKHSVSTEEASYYATGLAAAADAVWSLSFLWATRTLAHAAMLPEAPPRFCKA